MTINYERELETYILEISALVGNYNSHYALVLRHGKFFRVPAQKLPRGMQAGKMKDCYRNAFLSMTSDYIYTEGFAMVDGISMGFEHAWLTDRNGNVYDPTWIDGRGVAYYGIQFAIDYVIETAEKTRLAGVMINNPTIARNGLPELALYK